MIDYAKKTMAKMQFVNFKIKNREHLKLIEDRIKFPTYIGIRYKSTENVRIVALSEKMFNIIKKEILDKQKIPFKVITPKRIRLECETEENKKRWTEYNDLKTTKEKKTLSDKMYQSCICDNCDHATHHIYLDPDDIKQANKEFFDWIISNFSKSLENDLRIKKKAKETYGEKLI